jgi:hypothetical protein
VPYTFDIHGCERLDHGVVECHPLSWIPDWNIQLESGEQVRLETIYQYHTYGGLLCGFPHLAETHIEQAIECATRQFPYLSERYALLPPVIQQGRTPRKIYGEMILTDWEMLPPITSIAEFLSANSGNGVLAIWFQNQIGLPDANATEQIRKLDWQRHSVEILF